MSRVMYENETIEELFRDRQSRAVITRVRPQRKDERLKEITFYDHIGRPVAYIEDGEHIYTFSGKPCAYLYEGKYVYKYDGHHIGWFENGWVRDLEGACVFFTENAGNAGLAKPFRQFKPFKSFKQLKPMKCIREIPRMKTVNMMKWSNKSGEQFFV